jgi:hypothetical protein
VETGGMSNRKKQKSKVTNQLASPVSSNAIKKADWLNPFGLAMLGYYLLMALIGLLIPDNVFQTISWAKDFSDFMASLVPQIDRITALNIKPDVNRFYFSVLWAGSPVLFVLVALYIWDGRKHGYAIWTLELPLAVGVMLVCLMVCFGAQWLYGMTDPSNRQVRLMLGNVIGRSFWGSIVYAMGTSLCSAGLAVVLLGWLTGYIPKNIKRQGHV